MFFAVVQHQMLVVIQHHLLVYIQRFPIITYLRAALKGECA